jgi:hypothetical protein
MKKPTNQKAEILSELLSRKQIGQLVLRSVKSHSYYFSTSSSRVRIKSVNRYGRKIQYAEWKLSNKPEARKIYSSINAK